jgi:hypothetical protein
MVAVSLVGVGCAINVGPGPSDGQPTPSTTSVRVAHAAAETTAFDVCVAGEVVLENARFGRITSYSETQAGVVLFQVIDAGGDCDDIVGDDITINLASNRAYTVVALEDDDPIPLLDDTSPVRDGRARIRIINGSRNSLAVDVTDEGGFQLFDDVRYNEEEDYAYSEVPAGTYDLVITPLAGTRTPVSLGEQQLAEGHVYTVFVFGFADAEEDEEPFDAIIVDDGNAGTW